jgi:hypothetical protein
MMSKLTEPKLEVLRIIEKHDGDWNWYQVGRAAFDIMSEHPEIKLSDFVSAGLVNERIVEGEPLPKLLLTEKARMTLASTCNE